MVLLYTLISFQGIISVILSVWKKTHTHSHYRNLKGQTEYTIGIEQNVCAV